MRPRRLSDLDVRLAGLNLQPDSILADGARRQGDEVLAVELAITLDAGVDDAAIERGVNLQAACPVFRGQCGLETGEVGTRHMNEAAALERLQEQEDVYTAAQAAQATRMIGQ